MSQQLVSAQVYDIAHQLRIHGDTERATKALEAAQLLERAETHEQEAAAIRKNPPGIFATLFRRLIGADAHIALAKDHREQARKLLRQAGIIVPESST